MQQPTNALKANIKSLKNISNSTTKLKQKHLQLMQGKSKDQHYTLASKLFNHFHFFSTLQIDKLPIISMKFQKNAINKKINHKGRKEEITN